MWALPTCFQRWPHFDLFRLELITLCAPSSDPLPESLGRVLSCQLTSHLRFCRAAGRVAAGKIVRRYTPVRDVSIAVPEISESPWPA
jgi:hypothetical protein